MKNNKIKLLIKKKKNYLMNKNNKSLKKTLRVTNPKYMS